jgi:hypothetical protein
VKCGPLQITPLEKDKCLPSRTSGRVAVPARDDFLKVSCEEQSQLHSSDEELRSSYMVTSVEEEL